MVMVVEVVVGVVVINSTLHSLLLVLLLGRSSLVRSLLSRFLKAPLLAHRIWQLPSDCSRQ